MMAHVHAPLALIDPEILLLAYRSGIFPMSDARDDPEVFWIEPRLRAILPLDQFHLSRSLARTLRRGRYRVTCNAAFAKVMDNCAAPRTGDEAGSWISYRIQASYERLHALGRAHSIECWQDSDGAPPRLVGGLYGVGFDRVFCGESMFSLQSDASKVALAWLVAVLRRGHCELLDLGRNDCGRVAKVGSVKLTENMLIERYSHVMHIVSNVEGKLQAGLDALDVLKATFPAGTVSGAPKVRAMEIIDELEPIKRGIYAGAVGYLGFHGDMDLAIAIRTAVVKDKKLHVQAGAGIVADSDPHSEWIETQTKARAVLRAAELAEQGLDTRVD